MWLYIKGKKQTKTTEKFILDGVGVHGYLYGYDKVIYVKCNEEVWIYCKKCGEYFKQTPSNHLQGCGCPRCRDSKGEKETAKYLDIYNIKYIPQKRYEDCRDKKTLQFDFYIEEYNLCIEYQGKQHYELINFGGKSTKKQIEENLKNVQKHDKIKKDYCDDTNIELIAIPYWEKDNIKNIIKNLINTYKDRRKYVINNRICRLS